MSDQKIPTTGGSYTRDKAGRLRLTEDPTEQNVDAAPAPEPDVQVEPDTTTEPEA